MWKKIAAAAVIGAFFASSASAQVTVDGSIAGDGYGSAAAVQTVQTGFGDNASELNAAYAFTSGGNLHLTLTGNLENNFNKLNIFIDSVAGGQNVIDSSMNPTNDSWADNYNGMTFDSGFAADYLFIARNGAGKFDLDFNEVGGTGVTLSAGPEAGMNGLDIFGGSEQGSNLNVAGTGIAVGFDNSNGAGIGGDGSSAADASAAQAVQTGLELVIPLSLLGSPSLGDTILISAQINGSNHDYLSNQFLGGLAAPQGNLGNDGTGAFIDGNLNLINLNNFGGNQFFAVTVVPEPASAVCLLGVAALGLVRRRRS